MTATTAVGSAVPGVDATGAAHRVALSGDWALWRLSALRTAGFPLAWLEGFATGDADEETARAAAAGAVRRLVREPRFLEAVTWQNAGLVENWLGTYADELARDACPPLARRDQRESLVAQLAQRYCAKNETIGFFGPVAWARFVDGTDGIRSRGSGALRSRSVFVEAWAVGALAAALAEDPAVAPHLVARRDPVCSFRDGVLRRPRRPPEQVDGVDRALLELLEHPRRVADLLSACREVAGDEDPAAALDRLRGDGVVLVGFPVPVEDRPEVRLRAAVDGIPDVQVRASLGARLDALDRAVDDVRAAAGDPGALRTALGHVEEQLSGALGEAPRHDKPVRRFGRSLVYEDCRRDLDVDIGADVLDPLRVPLGLVLDAARWFTAETGAEVERDLRVRHRALAARAGDGVALCDLALASGDVLNGLPGTAADRVGADLLERWSEILATASGDPASLSSATVAPLVAALFPRRPVGWRAGRQHSPDLLLRRVRRGSRVVHQWVLGELHLALNTLENRPFATQADDREELLAASATDHPAGRFVPVYPRDAPEVTSRTYPPLGLDLPGRYHYWSYTTDDGHPGASSPLPGAGLLVHEEGGRLVVRPVDDAWEAPVLEVLGEFVTGLVVDRFRIRPPAAHHPRLLLDDVVVARETWTCPASEVPLPSDPSADYRHRELRAWLKDLGTPRRVFAKTPDQPKPILVDRDAPLSLRNVARAVRRTRERAPDAVVTLVEMLPTPDELWVGDDSGDLYTSELRVVAVDVTEDGAPVRGGG